MSRMNSDQAIKNSRTVNAPEQYVTVQIHNQSIKNKYRVHRSSVLNELRATQNILNESLNRNVSSHQSHFARGKKGSTSEKSLKANFSSLLKKKKIITESDSVREEVKPESEYKMSDEIKRKFNQIANISYQLQKACQIPKKDLKDYENSVQLKYRLPVISETPAFQRSLAQSPERTKLRKRWREKIKMGKKYTQHLKQNPFLYGILKQAKLKQTYQRQMQEETCLKTPQNIRDAYTQPIPQERKSAPLSQANTDFYTLFCSDKPLQETLYEHKVQLQPLTSLQQFSSGGEQTTFKDYSDHINLKEFIKTKQKMSFLQRIYNHIKEKYAGELKQMSNQQFKQPNLLALVYYHQNSFNLTEQEKKNLRKKLKFID